MFRRRRWISIPTSVTAYYQTSVVVGLVWCRTFRIPKVMALPTMPGIPAWTTIRPPTASSSTTTRCHPIRPPCTMAIPISSRPVRTGRTNSAAQDLPPVDWEWTDYKCPDRTEYQWVWAVDRLPLELDPGWEVLVRRWLLWMVAAREVAAADMDREVATAMSRAAWLHPDCRVYHRHQWPFPVVRCLVLEHRLKILRRKRLRWIQHRLRIHSSGWPRIRSRQQVSFAL